MKYLLSLLTAATLMMSLPAHASDKTHAPDPYTIKADYAVYAGGFRTLKATTSLREGRYDYSTYVRIETDGLLRTLAPWSGILMTVGQFEGREKTRLPRLHSFDNIWRGTNKRYEQHYDAQGRQHHIIIQEDGRPDEEKKPDDVLAEGSTDLLSATMEASRNITATGTCDSRQAVYDGKRRFILSFKEVAREDFTPSKYSAYDGEAIKCIVEITPDGGPWRAKTRGWMSIQEQSKERGHPPYVWFGKLTPENDTEHSGAYAPVKLQVKTAYGTLMLHMEDGALHPLNEERDVMEANAGQ